MQEPFRLGLVGAGRMGQNHLRALAEISAVQVVAAVDPVDEVRRRLVDQGIRAFGSMDKMLDAGGIDGALVAAPTTMHLQIVRALLDVGVPTLCEKPCGTSAHEAAEARDRAVAARMPLQIGFWRRFIPTLQELRERIQRGELGHLYRLSCLQWDEAPAAIGFRLTSGGILKDMGVHEFDVMRWLTGQEILSAAGCVSSIRTAEFVADDPEGIELVLELSEGAVADVSLGRRYPPGEIHRIEVMGTEGTENLVFVPPPHAWEPQGTIFPALQAQAESFAATVRGAPQVGATADDAVAALAAAELAAEAVGLAQGAR